MRMQSLSTRASRRATTFAIAVAVSVAGVAGASWSATGSGNAKAQAGRLQAVTATPAAVTSELFPGGTAEAALTLTNPNPVAMKVSSIAGDGAISSDSAACNDAGHGVTFDDQAGSWEVAKSASLAVTLTDAVTMALDSAEECQGATFTIPVAVVASVSGQGGSGTTTTTTPAELAWQPSSYTYPAVESGGGSATANFSVRNTGGAPTTIENGQMGNAEFTVVGTSCGATATLQPGQSCTYTIRFAPAIEGPRNATFNVRVPGTSTWSTLTLLGHGLTRANLVIEPPSWNFGDVAVGGTSTVKTFIVRNTGQSTARTVFTQFGGFDTSSFSWAGGTCSTMSEIAPNGGSCTVGITFRPSSPGAKNAFFRASYNNNAFSTIAQLTGTGI